MDEKIINKARELFLRYGYTRVTLAEVAKEMGISKKTIYNHFDGKEDLLYKVMDNAKQVFEIQISEIERKQGQEFQEKILEILTMLGMWVSDYSTFSKDLKVNQFEAFAYMNSIRRELILGHAMSILEMGKKEGVFDDTYSPMALFVFLAAAEKVTDEDYKSNLPQELTKHFPGNPTEIFKVIVELIYKGIKK